ncbi:Urease accessory protein UreD [Aquimixticola soesokkakensis]|uniref:Urease accessory protein UreD n=1 Tax=Aquimixticola soesokkakensis TaxID=1519096 RepID=A0A1Y5S0S0_9RHOB|nr:urease accessory protein UreD [Aquimixticola soesokkakensis]SLN29862.1 Urease accessory protein UreD [Aquimixticola soesokkakensis]
MQRVNGRAAVVMGPRGVIDLHQSGSAKAMLPRVHDTAAEVVFLNTSGGLTGGDVMRFSLEAQAGTRVVGTTQTAERAYAASAGTAQVCVDLSVGAGGVLDWLPQETILFEGASLARETRCEMADDAQFCCVETVVLGRAAMGERLNNVHFSDRRVVKRGARLDWIEPVQITPQVLDARASAVTLAGQRAFSTVVLLARGAEDGVERLRSVSREGVTAGVSGWDGKLVVRAMASDGWPLRRYVARILERMRGTDLPRVWQ